MKKIFALSLVLALLILPGCSAPDSLQLDLSQGCGYHMKLLHLNASTKERRRRIQDFHAVLESAQPLEKDLELFAYYPDYEMTFTSNGEKTTVLLDVNGEFVDFYYPENGDGIIYRSPWTAGDLRRLIHQPAD